MNRTYYEAPHDYPPENGPGRPKVFLAGGIVGCPRWQDAAARQVRESRPDVVVFNPNRENFPIRDPAAGPQQVAWEQHHLHLPNTLTLFWFPPSDPTITTQPIAMFELGQAIGEARRLVVGAHPAYPRHRDVELLLGIHRPDLAVHQTLTGTVDAALAELPPGNHGNLNGASA